MCERQFQKENDKIHGTMILDAGLERLTSVETGVLNRSADRAKIYRQEVDESQIIDIAWNLKIFGESGWGGSRVARKGYVLEAALELLPLLRDIGTAKLAGAADTLRQAFGWAERSADTNSYRKVARQLAAEICLPVCGDASYVAVVFGDLAHGHECRRRYLCDQRQCLGVAARLILRQKPRQDRRVVIDDRIGNQARTLVADFDFNVGASGQLFLAADLDSFKSSLLAQGAEPKTLEYVNEAFGRFAERIKFSGVPAYNPLK